MRRVTSLPIIADVDAGFGDVNVIRPDDAPLWRRRGSTMEAERHIASMSELLDLVGTHLLDNDQPWPALETYSRIIQSEEVPEEQKDFGGEDDR